MDVSACGYVASVYLCGEGEDLEASRAIMEIQMGYDQVKGPEHIGTSITLYHAVLLTP